MNGLVNLRRQVQKTLRRVNGGTGNRSGWSHGVIKQCINRTGSTITLHTMVRLSGAYNDPRVTPTTTTDEVTVLGVVVGYWDPDDIETLIEDDAPDVSQVAVLVSGTTLVRLGGTATRGQYAFAHSTAGTAYSSATAATGAFGVFQSSGTAGNKALVVLRGSAQTVSAVTPVTYGTPALTLGTTNGAGSIAEAIRRDATILAFDGTAPAAIGTAATGAAAVAARRDHVHATGAGTPAAMTVTSTAAVGTGPAAAMTDHRHAFTTPALDDLSDAATAGAASGDHLVFNGSLWVPESPAAAPLIWRPLMDGAVPGTIVLDATTGEAIMALSPP